MLVGSLFSGIGGIDLGFERAGHDIAWQVEIDPWCREILSKHWPQVPKFEDVTQVGADNLSPVDVLAGGFPCQDVSNAGKKEGINGARSGLWSQFHRLIRDLRPRYVFVENVPGLLVRGMDRVLGDLAAAGYDAEWEVLSAADVGAPHLRKRVWIIAHPSSRQLRHQPRGGSGSNGQGATISRDNGDEGSLAHPKRGRREYRCSKSTHIDNRQTYTQDRGQWETEPDVGRVAHGVPKRVDRLRGLGNAVVPQCVEYLVRKYLI